MKRRPDFYTRSPEERAGLELKRDESWRLRALRQSLGKKYLPDGETTKAQEVFGVKARRVRNILAEHEQYEEQFCHGVDVDFAACSASYFIPVPGRNTGPELSAQEKDAIILGILDRTREAIYGSGEIVPVKLLEGINRLDVFKYASAICPTLTYHSTRRFIKSLLDGEESVALLYAAYGSRWVKEHLAPKKSNIPPKVDDWWIFDDYHLGFYINYRGTACRAILLWGIEPCSKYIVGLRIVPTIRIGGEQQITGVSYTKEDYGILLATSMVRSGRRPRRIYNDNAKAFTALDRPLQALLDLPEEPMGMTRSIPGEPWGRGLLENRNGEFRQFIAQYYGLADRDFRNKDQAAQAAVDKLLTDQQLTQELEKYRNQVNTEHIKDRRHADGLRPSRQDLWTAAIPRSAPPIRRLISLPYPEPPIQTTVRVEDAGFNFDSQVYVPICEGGEGRKYLYKLWLNAAAKTMQANTEFAICAVKLDIVGWQVEIMLNDGEWFTAVPKEKQNITAEEHMAARNGALAELDETVRARLVELREKIQQEKGGLPRRDNITRTYRVDATPEPITLTDETSSAKKRTSKRRDKTKVRKAPSAPPSVPTTGDDGLTTLERMMRDLSE